MIPKKIKIKLKGGDIEVINELWWNMPDAMTKDAKCMLSVGQELQSKLQKKAIDISIYDKKNKNVTITLTYHHAYFLWRIIGSVGRDIGIYETIIIQRIYNELDQQLS